MYMEGVNTPHNSSVTNHLSGHNVTSSVDLMKNGITISGECGQLKEHLGWWLKTNPHFLWQEVNEYYLTLRKKKSQVSTLFRYTDTTGIRQKS